MMTRVDRLFEAHLTVSDLDASIAFYRDRVGLELAHLDTALSLGTGIFCSHVGIPEV